MEFIFLLALAALVVAILTRRRIASLEQQIRDLRGEIDEINRGAARASPPVSVFAPAPRPPERVDVAPLSPLPPTPPPIEPAAPPPSFAFFDTSGAAEADREEPPMGHGEHGEHAEHAEPEEPAEPEPPATVIPSPEKAAREIDSLELAIGGSWLNKIGVALLVLGIALALGYTLTHLGPAGKTALATALSLAMLLAGVWLEKLEAYRSYARGLIAGGWAAFYVTTYAAHEWEATRIIDDARLGFALLLLVGVGMIVHSLRYENQGLTTLAYGLAYASIVIHSISAYTLAAASLLGLGTVLHLLRRRWFAVAFGGIAATYGSLLLWYHGQQPMTSRTLQIGLAALAIDWLVFLTADFAPESASGSAPGSADETERYRVRAVSLLNAFAAAGLGCLAWMSVWPGTVWQPLLVLGVAYAVTSASLRRMARFTTHQVHSLAAALFIGVATGNALELTPASWVWLVEAQVVVLIGVWLKDRYHRILGCVLFLLPMAAILFEQLDDRSRQPDGAIDLGRLLLTAAACGAYYLTFARLKPFISSGGAGQAEKEIRRMLSYAAFALVLLALWVQLPLVYVAPASALLAVLLFEISARFEMVELRVQSYLAAAWASMAAFVLTAPSQTLILGAQARILSLSVAALALFAVYARGARSRVRLVALEEALPQAFSYVAFFLVLLALWFGLPHPYAAPASALLMLILLEISGTFSMKELRVQSYLAAAWSAATALALSAPSQAQVGGFPERILTLSLVALFFFVIFARRSKGRPALLEWEESLSPAFTWAGAALAALAVWLEARPVAVGPSWTLMALLLVEAGIGFRVIHLRRPGYALLIASQISLVVSNLEATDSVSGVSVRAATMFPAIAATYYLWWRLRALSAWPAAKGDGGDGGAGGTGGTAANDLMGDRYDEGFGRAISYAAAAMVGLFSRFEFGLNGVALRWSIAMVVLLAAGYRLRDADFRLQAYALAAAVSVRAIGFDFQNGGPVLGLDGPLAVALVGLVAYVTTGLLIQSRSGLQRGGDRRTSRLESRLETHGRDIMWMLGVALAALYLYRTQVGFMLVVGWAVEGLLATAAGFASKSQPLRFAGLGLLALALLLTLVRAFTTFDTLGRIISFIVLGIVLLLVSLTYTRYRQRVRKTS